jgi:DNA topoisomerase VI subunit A
MNISSDTKISCFPLLEYFVALSKNTDYKNLILLNAMEYFGSRYWNMALRLILRIEREHAQENSRQKAIFCKSKRVFDRR